MSELEELKQKLAAIEHERWSDWQKWCHKILEDNIKPANFALHVKPVLERWEKQIATPYDKLSDQEKASDMEQVDRYWHLIASLIATKELEAQTNAVAWTVGIIDTIHTNSDPILDRTFKGIKNNIRDIYKANTGIDPTPKYPVTTKLNKQGEIR